MMNATATLTTLAALAVAGAAAACECSTKETKQLTAAPAPVGQVVVVGNDASEDKKSYTFKVVETDGKARYWVNGKEVDKAGFEKAKKKSNVYVATAPDKSKNKKTSWVTRAEPAPEAPRVDVAAPSSKPRLGVVLGSVSDELAEKLHVDADGVILIERVIDGTPAANAGLKSYDVLVEFDGEDDLNVTKLRKLIAKQDPGDQVEVIVLRDGDEEEFEVVFHGGDMHFAPEPPHPAPAPRARFFGGELDEAQQEQIEKAMRLAEEYSQRAQKQAMVWTHEIEKQAKDIEGLGQKLALRFNPESREEFEAAMEHLHESLAELDVDFDFDFEFDFDEEDFPRMHFIELDDKNENKAVILERKLRAEVERHARQGERMQRQHERVQRLHEEAAQRNRMHNELRHEKQGEVERLEARIAELEAMIDKLSHELERMRPRGVRN